MKNNHPRRSSAAAIKVNIGLSAPNASLLPRSSLQVEAIRKASCLFHSRLHVASASPTDRKTHASP